MCDRARLSSDVSEIKLTFRIPPERPTPNFPPSWNVAPTDSLPIVRFNPKDAQRSLDMMRWGLIPYWAKDIKVGFSNINAKAEGIESKPAFGKAFERRRCLVPGRQFLRMEKDRGRQAALRACARRSRPRGARGRVGELALAGRRRSFAILTTAPNALCAEIHNRMPVILKPEAWPARLGEEPAGVPELKSLLAPLPADQMIAWPVQPARRQCQEQRFEFNRPRRRGVIARAASKNLSTWTIIRRWCQIHSGRSKFFPRSSSENPGVPLPGFSPFWKAAAHIEASTQYTAGRPVPSPYTFHILRPLTRGAYGMIRRASPATPSSNPPSMSAAVTSARCGSIAASSTPTR
jgi:putative SOS response-associated peptidase YedK